MKPATYKKLSIWGLLIPHTLLWLAYVYSTLALWLDTSSRYDERGLTDVWLLFVVGVVTGLGLVALWWAVLTPYERWADSRRRLLFFTLFGFMALLLTGWFLFSTLWGMLLLMDPTVARSPRDPDLPALIFAIMSYHLVMLLFATKQLIKAVRLLFYSPIGKYADS